MAIVYETTLPPKQQLFELFETTGWNAEYGVDADQLYSVFQNSWYYISAYDNDRLVGVGRLISDGLLHALILDMIVHPEYQLKGIGRRILEDLVDKCKAAKIRDIQLFCVKGKKGFYEKNGFRPRSENGPGMEIKFTGKDYERMNDR